MPDLNYCGAVLAVVGVAPATIDPAGFAALSWTAIVGGLVEVGEVGDTSNGIVVPYLNGRKGYSNGSVDGGERPFTYAFRPSDPGQNILRARSNTNLVVSCRLTDPDGTIQYWSGLVANVRDIARTDTNYKGQTGVFRVETPTIRA